MNNNDSQSAYANGNYWIRIPDGMMVVPTDCSTMLRLRFVDDQGGGFAVAYFAVAVFWTFAIIYRLIVDGPKALFFYLPFFIACNVYIYYLSIVRFKSTWIDVTNNEIIVYKNFGMSPRRVFVRLPRRAGVTSEAFLARRHDKSGTEYYGIRIYYNNEKYNIECVYTNDRRAQVVSTFIQAVLDGCTPHPQGAITAEDFYRMSGNRL